MDARVKLAHDDLLYNVAAELVLYMDTDDIVESLLRGGEAEFFCPRGLEISRPAGDDADDERVGLAPDPRGDLVAGHALERRDLLADGGRQAGHGEVAAGTRGGAIHGRGMDEETHGGARRGVPVPD